MYTLSVSASKKYNITVASDLSLAKEALSSLTVGDKIAVITDDTVYGLYGNPFIDVFADKTVYTHVIPHGEAQKNANNYVELLNSLVEDGLTRNDAVLTFGGGVVGDLGGFVASTYMRGVTLIAVPTTLLSMVDSSVGGKTAINLETGKNLCGTFYQPSAVYVNTSYIKTLPDREVLSGMGEVVKYTYIDGEEGLDVNGKIEDVVYRCLKIKAKIIERDERETGERKILNFGHTVGHAIERLSNFKFSHGECVAKGIKAALDVSRKRYAINGGVFDRLYERLYSVGFDLTCEYTPKELIDGIKNDKKRERDGVDFVLIGSDLRPKTEYLSLKELEGYLEK